MLYDHLDAGVERGALPLLRPHLEVTAVTASLLPLPDDPRFPHLLSQWDAIAAAYPHPRSVWLRAYELLLREFYPQANSRSLSLTARHAAPFYLRDGHDVP